MQQYLLLSKHEYMNSTIVFVTFGKGSLILKGHKVAPL